MRNTVLAVALGASLLLVGAARSAELIANGGFTTGDFTDWQLFTTANGSLGLPPDPQVTTFAVTGSGAQNAAEFEVGSSDQQEGGGIRQTFNTGGGLFTFRADFAAFSRLNNGAEGVFSAILDGVVEESLNRGPIAAGATDRGVLNFTTTLAPGRHTIELLITRDFSNGPSRGDTPFQYLTNITGTGAAAAIPEPATWTTLLVGFAALGLALRRGRARASSARQDRRLPLNRASPWEDLGVRPSAALRGGY